MNFSKKIQTHLTNSNIQVRAEFSGNLQISTDETLFPKDSIAVVPQITTIDKTRLLNKILNLKDYTMFQLKENIKLLLQI
nr:type II toxin-antitoxin system PemK/MazF family toxin [Treponema pectinovorum]